VVVAWPLKPSTVSLARLFGRSRATVPTARCCQRRAEPPSSAPPTPAPRSSCCAVRRRYPARAVELRLAHEPGSPVAMATDGLRSRRPPGRAVDRLAADGYRLAGGIGQHEHTWRMGLHARTGGDHRVPGRTHRLMRRRCRISPDVFRRADPVLPTVTCTRSAIPDPTDAER
jgi:hypothetical protein